MRFKTYIVLALGFIAASSPATAEKGGKTVWLYSAADRPEWCATADAATAKASASSERFASGESAVLHYRDGVLASAIMTTESEDAYVEDTYTFDKALNVTTLLRRGAYAEDPFLKVTYLRDGAGKLTLSAASRQLLRRQDKAGRETYFIDWPRYDKFAKLPFAGVVNPRPPATITRPCKPES